jgi:hypothetical protein
MLDDALAMALGDLDPDDGIEMPEAFECLNRVASYDEVGINGDTQSPRAQCMGALNCLPETGGMRLEAM